MVEKYLKLNEHQRTLFWLIVIGVVIFIGLCPFFFFYEDKGYSYPMGWLLGTLAEILSFFTIIITPIPIGKVEICKIKSSEIKISEIKDIHIYEAVFSEEL